MDPDVLYGAVMIYVNPEVFFSLPTSIQDLLLVTGIMF